MRRVERHGRLKMRKSPKKSLRFLESWGTRDVTVEAAGAFVDRILGGDMQFSKLSSPPELEPHYLLDKDEP